MQIDNQSINALLDQRLLQWHAMQDKRKYLGASMIGDECIRKVQLQFRHWASFGGSCNSLASHCWILCD